MRDRDRICVSQRDHKEADYLYILDPCHFQLVVSTISNFKRLREITMQLLMLNNRCALLIK